MKRVFIVHGWDGYPEEGWLPWLKKELEEKGFEVFVPAMSHPEEPTIEDWVNYLSEQVKEIDEDTLFVGHSVGCQTILRLLERVNTTCGGVVFVAGWFDLRDEVMSDPESAIIAKPWINTPIDFEKIKPLCPKIIYIYSDNDPFVDTKNAKIFEEKLGAKIVVEHDKEHFSGEDGVTKLPSALEAVLEIGLYR